MVSRPRGRPVPGARRCGRRCAAGATAGRPSRSFAPWRARAAARRCGGATLWRTLRERAAPPAGASLEHPNAAPGHELGGPGGLRPARWTGRERPPAGRLLPPGLPRRQPLKSVRVVPPSQSGSRAARSPGSNRCSHGDREPAGGAAARQPLHPVRRGQGKRRQQTGAGQPGAGTTRPPRPGTAATPGGNGRRLGHRQGGQVRASWTTARPVVSGGGRGKRSIGWQAGLQHRLPASPVLASRPVGPRRRPRLPARQPEAGRRVLDRRPANASGATPGRERPAAGGPATAAPRTAASPGHSHPEPRRDRSDAARPWSPDTPTGPRRHAFQVAAARSGPRVGRTADRRAARGPGTRGGPARAPASSQQPPGCPPPAAARGDTRMLRRGGRIPPAAGNGPRSDPPRTVAARLAGTGEQVRLVQAGRRLPGPESRPPAPLLRLAEPGGISTRSVAVAVPDGGRRRRALRRTSQQARARSARGGRATMHGAARTTIYLSDLFAQTPVDTTALAGRRGEPPHRRVQTPPTGHKTPSSPGRPQGYPQGVSSDRYPLVAPVSCSATEHPPRSDRPLGKAIGPTNETGG